MKIADYSDKDKKKSRIFEVLKIFTNNNFYGMGK